ncbi:MAG TPA: enoyl-CoA hydratase-related protein [Candidatus Eisenbacteria bacterium]|nr:enoyl-CoA hydratase-related protein [Candidatus Eisenbacteria bacterium]
MPQSHAQCVTLTLSYDAAIATVTLNRPEKRNAISHALIEEIHLVLREVEESPAHVLILTGSGAAFCSGMDLDNLRDITRLTADENRHDSERMAGMFRALYEFPKVTIAAVNGPAIAGGCGLATLCDFTLASTEAKFGYTEVRIGFVPAIVSTFLLRQVGEKQARDLLLTGRIIDADEARRLGLVSEVVRPENLLPRAYELAKTLTANSPASLLATKRLLKNFSLTELDRQVATAVEENARIRTTHDFREGLTAFLEKRKPNWTGR